MPKIYNIYNYGNYLISSTQMPKNNISLIFQVFNIILLKFKKLLDKIFILY